MSRKLVIASLMMAAGVFGFVPRAGAQYCSTALGQVGPISGLPFQADIQQTFFSNAQGKATDAPPVQTKTQHVARDSQGRIFADSYAGKFKVQTPNGESTEVERHVISICDPVADRQVRWDSLTKSAMISKGVPHVLGEPRGLVVKNPKGFCAMNLHAGLHIPNGESEDLGERNISGLLAKGVVERRSLPRTTFSENATARPEQVTETEQWCSDDLEVMVLRSSGTKDKGKNSQLEMTNIKRGEPDEALFQIPADFTVAERVASPNDRPMIGLAGCMSDFVPMPYPVFPAIP